MDGWMNHWQNALIIKLFHLTLVQPLIKVKLCRMFLDNETVYFDQEDEDLSQSTAFSKMLFLSDSQIILNEQA